MGDVADVGHPASEPVTIHRTRPVDFDAVRRDLGGRCFICEFVAGNAEFSHHVVYEDEQAVAFLNRYPVLYGHVVVAPKEHREAVTGDFTRDEYLALQEVVHGVGEALRRVVPTERLYVLSLGSQQGNRHVHWHLAPLPPGVPYSEQQLAALDKSVCLDLGEREMADLAASVRAAIAEGSEVPDLSDGVVILGGFDPSDVEAQLAGEDEEQARRFGWYPRRSTPESVRSAILSWQRDWTLNGPTRAFAMREASSRELVGGCQIRLREKRMAELSYWTFPRARRKGYATRAVTLACAFAFSQLAVERIEAYVEPDNVASRRVLEKARFHEEGLVREHELTAGGERRDMLLFSLLPHETEHQAVVAEQSGRDVRRIRATEYQELRRARLKALAYTPELAQHLANEEAEPISFWRDRAERAASSTVFATFVAVERGRFVGIVDGFRSDDAVTVEVGGMWVRPDRRRCGIGRELLETVLGWAREGGVTRAGLWVRNANKPARLLYESDGFTQSESARNGLRLEKAL